MSYGKLIVIIIYIGKISEGGKNREKKKILTKLLLNYTYVLLRTLP